MASARDDMNELLGLCVPFAQEMVEQHGAFHPFGALLSADGRPQLAGAAMDLDLPDAPELILRLNTVFRRRAQAGEIRASALCTDIRLEAREGGEAIRLAVEHRDAPAMEFTVPYRRQRLRGYRFDPLIAARGVAHVFVDEDE